ncbi:MAG: hypothetical protein PHS02_02815 [Candidatus ainarchaeum sp.]|nr:hypothetical protein [Candidatus ainarchaeum sp.]
MHKAYMAVFFLLMLHLAYPAYVQGEIYATDMQKMDRTVLRIEGGFSYQTVVEKNNYSVFLPNGTYEISASHFDDNGELDFFVNETVVVGVQDQEVDLVLKPIRQNGMFYLLIGLALAGVIAYYLLARRKNANAGEPETAEMRINPEDEPKRAEKKMELDEDAEKVLDALERMEKRATQKELKEALGFSDAKLSLILTELEQMGHVKKFKRGRGNVVRKTR